ncbi:cupredoxin domain-containing protein [Lacimonas salitolerans]|uniref:Plastocyanin n=1 Tax=Lacimonas salitolerans TaxID=1323750 RepID=A0ABW4E9Q6_9RHOB
MLRKTAVTALALGLSIASAQAAEHEIAIVAEGFFPEITYVQPGDTVTFVNTDTAPRRVFGDKFTFASDPLQEADAFTMTVIADMPNAFFGRTGTEELDDEATAVDLADVNGEGQPMRGVLSFAPPPQAD